MCAHNLTQNIHADMLSTEKSKKHKNVLFFLYQNYFFMNLIFMQFLHCNLFFILRFKRQSTEIKQPKLSSQAQTNDKLRICIVTLCQHSKSEAILYQKYFCTNLLIVLFFYHSKIQKMVNQNQTTIAGIKNGNLRIFIVTFVLKYLFMHCPPLY